VRKFENADLQFREKGGDSNISSRRIILIERTLQEEIRLFQERIELERREAAERRELLWEKMAKLEEARKMAGERERVRREKSEV
jgi:hypothetical protein